MKPLLIIPPAPQRWPAFQELLGHLPPPQINNLRRRIVNGVPGAQDAFAVIPVGSRFLAHVCICRRGETGMLAYGFTRPDERLHGHARRLMQSLLEWFDMTGGRRLYLCTTAELDMGFYAKFGFVPLRRAVWAPFDRLTMIRPAPGAGEDPLPVNAPVSIGSPAPANASADDSLEVRELTRADWPAMVQLLQYRCGPDPRVPLEETAVTADVITLDMIDHSESGSCLLLGAFARQKEQAAGALTSLATLCTDRSGKRTFAIVVPNRGAPPGLGEAIVRNASQRGYEHVDFPMDALAVPDVPLSAMPEAPAPVPPTAV